MTKEQNNRTGCGRAWLSAARLWMITDHAAARGRGIANIVADGIRGGVDVVVVRLKELDTASLVREAAAIAGICRDEGIPWVLSHNVELVGELQPDGVHLGKNDQPVNEVRLKVGDDVAIGYSAHSVEEMAFAAGLGADYCWFSPIFDTRKGDHVLKGKGLEAVQLVSEAADAIARNGVPFPVVYLGGITVENVRDVAAQGGARVAAIGAICGAIDVEKAARAMKKALAGE